MIILVSGGCKNGKSSFAERVAIKLAKDNKKYYIATMVPFDEEDRERIKRHREERKDFSFETIEVNDKLLDLKKINKNEVMLFDSVTAFVLNCIIKLPDDYDEFEVYNKILDEFETSIFCDKKNAVFVTDYVYSNCELFTEYTEKYNRLLSKVCCYIASKADYIIDIKYRNKIFYKGSDINNEIFNIN